MDDAELTVGICAPGCAGYTRKQTDELVDFVKRPQIGAKGLVWVKLNEDGSIKSSVGKFFSDDELRAWAERMDAKPGDLMLIMSGPAMKTRKMLCELRLEMGRRLGLRPKNVFAPLWVVDFPPFGGMRRHSAITQCTTPSRRPIPRTYLCCAATPAKCVPRHTI